MRRPSHLRLSRAVLLLLLLFASALAKGRERRLHLLRDGQRLCPLRLRLLGGPLRLRLGLRRLGLRLAADVAGVAATTILVRILPLAGFAACPRRVRFLRRLLGGREPGVRELLRGVATIKKALRGTRICVFTFGSNFCACKRSPMGETNSRGNSYRCQQMGPRD